MPVRAIILAAGGGARLGGRPKALLPLAGATALERIARTLRAAGVEAVVVTGAHRGEVEAEARRLDLPTVHNAAWEGGRTGSAQAGWREAGPVPVLLWPVDVPLVRPATVRSLARRSGALAAVPLVGERRGHPVMLGLGVREEVLALGPDQPLHEVVRRHARQVPFDDPGALLNINEPADLAAAQRLAEGMPVA